MPGTDAWHRRGPALSSPMTVNCRRAVLGLLLLGVCAAAHPSAARAQSPDIFDYALFAIDELHSAGLRVTRGDLGVNNGALLLSLRGVLDAPGSTVSADVVQLPPESHCSQLNTNSALATGTDCTP